MVIRMAIAGDPSANALFAALAALGAGLFIVLYGSLIGRLLKIERRIVATAHYVARAAH